MAWMQRFLDRLSAPRDPEGEAEHALYQARDRTRETVLRTLQGGLHVRESQMGILEHSAMVSTICDTLARTMRLSEADAYILRTAARLHEVGMFSIPPALLLRPTPLTRGELERVRWQAMVSADIAEPMHHPRIVGLIRSQYQDFASLRGHLSDADLLLAGILRVADVVAAVTHPRPYQDPLPWNERARVLHSGAGTRFHPLAVEHALELPILQ